MILGLATGCGSGADTAPAPLPSSTAAEQSAAGATDVTRPLQPLQGPFPVERVVDGDTVVVSTAAGAESIRLIGIDTPETVDPNDPVECFGPEASAYASSLMAGTSVWLELDPSQGSRDRYDRLLAYVWLTPTRMFNEAAIRGGFAIEYTYAAAYAHRDSFLAAQREAADAGAGLWGACGGSADLPASDGDQQQDPVEPPAGTCDPNYGNACVPISAADLDCADIDGWVRVLGDDPHGLDRDGDGFACES